jgi:phospholipid/cholesterol/gamma-HCH transport system substrate-binding protein
LVARAASGGALLVGLVLVLVVLFGTSSGHTYHLLFSNGGQLVKGNQVLVSGQPIGKVDDVTLTDNAQAEVTITTDRPLHEGTTAVIRATSLSGIANRYVSISPGPNNAPELEDGATLTGQKTTSPVDLDQLFNTFRPRTRTALQNVIQGSAEIYAGHTGGAQRTYHYFAPSLEATRRLFAELTSDSQAFSQFLVDGSKTLNAIAARRNDLSALTSNANQALGAIASQNTALDRSLVAFPPALRQANTTFVNLRAALDDLTPLVNESKPATKDLAPFLRKLRPVATHSVPVVHNLRLAIDRGGKANDLTDALRDLPAVHAKASNAVPLAIKGLDDSQPFIQFARPYAPDLFAFVAKFGEVTANYDASGHYARVSTEEANFFHNCVAGDSSPVCVSPYGTGDLAPIPPVQQFNDLAFGQFLRCPGGATQPIPGSNPFTDDGSLLAGGQAPNPKCDVTAVPPGP